MVKLLLHAVALIWVLIPVIAAAGPLDDYYLSRFKVGAESAATTRVLKEAVPVRAERCRTMLHRSLKRDWNQLEPATQKVLGKYVTRPTLSGQTTATSAPSFNSPGGHFAIHYTRTGTDAPDLTDLDGDGVPDWVEKVAAVFEEVYDTEVTGMGFRPPPVTRYDVYLMDLVPDQAYGFTTDDGAPSGGSVSVGSYIEIDKSFSDPMFTVNGTYIPEQMLKVTAAHEFHHGIQFGYNYYFEFWYAEATATWMEDEVYDSVNQLYDYLDSYISHRDNYGVLEPLALNGPTDGASEYGRWIFNRYLAEKHGGREVVRAAWEKLATLRPGTSPTTSGGDIQMAPVLDTVLSASYGSSLAADFFELGKRIYARDWTTHTADLSLIPKQSNTASYSVYPVPSTTVTLPRYAFAFYRFAPSSTLPTLKLALTQGSGIKSALYKKSGGVVTEMDANSGGNSYTVNGFSSLKPASDEIVLVIANASATDGQQASFRTVSELFPGAPTGVSATAGNSQATVSFTPPASSGAGAITSYTVTAAPGGMTGTGTGNPVVVTGLSNGTPYTFTVTAANVYGSGAASSPSSSVTPFAGTLAGDCDNNGSVTISDVQSAINMFLGIKPVLACMDIDSSGGVSIAEVQKVINGFLNL